MNRIHLTVALVVGALLLSVGSAAARPPAGDWTFLRKDAFRHYACKVPDRAARGTWQIRTATFINGNDDARELRIGAYAAIARGGNRNIVVSRTDTRWQGAYIKLTLRGGVRNDDRLWVQGSYYGPAKPWSDGTRIAAITRCG